MKNSDSQLAECFGYDEVILSKGCIVNMSEYPDIDIEDARSRVGEILN